MRGRGSRLGPLPLALAFASCFLGCGDDDAAPTDGGGPDGPAALEPVAAALPELTPCPDGWRAVPVGAAMACDPWPEGGRVRCGATETLLPGGCAPLPTCPAGDFAEELAALGGDVRWVQEGGAGDGSAGAPFGSIGQALVGATRSTVIALGKGTYTERINLPSGVTLWGACPSETFIRSDEPLVTPRDAVVAAAGDDIVLRDVTLQSGTRAGLRIVGSATLEEVVIEGTHSAGIVVDAGADLQGTDVTVRGTRLVRGFAVGLALGPGSTVALSRVSLTENVSSGISLLEARATLTDAVIADNGHDALFDPLLGRGVEVLGGSRFECVRCAVDNVRTRALYVEDPGSFASFDQSLLRARTPGMEDGAGRGLVAWEGTEVHLTETWVDGFRQVAVRPRGAGTIAGLRDVVFQGGQGVSILVQEGAQLTLARTYLKDAAVLGLVVSDPASLVTATDLVVDGTVGDLAGNWGGGVQVLDGARLVGERVRVSRAHMLGVIVGGVAPSTASLTDVVVEDTRPRLCAETGCGDGHGDGIVSVENGSVEVTGFRVSGAARAGLHAAFGELRVRDGVVRDNAIGAAIQTPGFDLMTINDNVVYRDNLRRVDTSSLPVEVPRVDF